MPDKIDIHLSKQKLFVYAVLAIVTLAVFWQVHQYDFINVDDQAFISDNGHVPSGITLEGIRWAFGTTFAGFWHPLTWLSFMLDNQLYGMKAGGYHITNLFFHILSCLLLFGLLNQTTKEIWKSAFVAALFALHPLQVESVAWVALRKDILCAFFMMLTLYSYVHYTQKPALKRYLLVIFCFACALMSKSTAVTLPVIMILLDYWPLSRRPVEMTSKKGGWLLWQLKEKAIFFLLSAFASLMTIHIWRDPSGGDVPLASRFMNAPNVFISYIEKMFWPHNLTFFNYFPRELPLWQVAGAILLIIFMTAAVIILAKRFPYLFVGWFWYAVTILPVLGIVKNSIFWTHDHYTYIPSIGIGMMLGWGIPLLIPRSDASKNILFSAGTAVLIVLALLSWRQCGYWKNSVTLLNHDLLVSKDNYMAHSFLGLALLDKGNVGAAMAHFNETIRINPRHFSTYVHRGAVYLKYGQYQSALDDFNKAIHIDPANAEAHNNRGIACFNMGQHQQAIRDFSKATELKKDYVNAYNNRAFVYLKQGDKKSGCDDAQKACALGNCQALEYAKNNRLCGGS